MIQSIPEDIFRASFKFYMGDKLREKMEGGERDETFFQCTYMCTLQTPIQIVQILKIVGPLSKMKPYTRRGPKQQTTARRSPAPREEGLNHGGRNYKDTNP
jgi:hypothetical protein